MSGETKRSASSRFMRSDGSVTLRRVGLPRPMLRHADYRVFHDHEAA